MIYTDQTEIFSVKRIPLVSDQIFPQSIPIDQDPYYRTIIIKWNDDPSC